MKFKGKLEENGRRVAQNTVFGVVDRTDEVSVNTSTTNRRCGLIWFLKSIKIKIGKDLVLPFPLSTW